MNPPSNTPPPVPGPSNVPPAGTPPPARTGGGLFTTRNIVIGLVVLVLGCCVCGGIGTFAFLNFAGKAAEQFATSVPNQILTQAAPFVTQAASQTRTPSSSSTRPPISLPTRAATPAAGNDEAAVTLIGNNFMTQLKGANWAAAYALCTTDLQDELGSAVGLGKRITDGKAQPASWKFEDFNIGDTDAQIDGTVVFTSNRTGTLRLVLDRVGNSFKISGFNLQPK